MSGGPIIGAAIALPWVGTDGCQARLPSPHSSEGRAPAPILAPHVGQSTPNAAANVVEAEIFRSDGF